MASYAEHNQPAQRPNLNKGGNMVKNTTNQRPLHRYITVTYLLTHRKQVLRLT